MKINNYSFINNFWILMKVKRLLYRKFCFLKGIAEFAFFRRKQVSGFSSHSSEIWLNHSNAFLVLVTIFSEIFCEVKQLYLNLKSWIVSSLSLVYFVVLQLYLDACLQPANKWEYYYSISCCVTLITYYSGFFGWSLTPPSLGGLGSE